MKNKNLRNSLGKKILIFGLEVISKILGNSTKNKLHEPTTEEIISGERIIGSDKYEFPDKKLHQ